MEHVAASAPMSIATLLRGHALLYVRRASCHNSAYKQEDSDYSAYFFY